MAFKNNRKTFILFWFLSLSGFLLASIAYSEKTLYLFYSLKAEPFLSFIRILCLALFGLLVLKRINQRFLQMNLLKLIGALIFLPVLLLPVFRCYFKVPYIFCRVCPDKCPWGLSKLFFVGTFVLLNLSRRFWCRGICPFGSFQECQAQISKKHLKPFPWLSATSYVILFFVLGVYFLTFFGLPLVSSFRLGGYAWVTITVSIASLIITLAFFVHKFWCRYLCPIGAIAEVTSKFQSLINTDKDKMHF